MKKLKRLWLCRNFGGDDIAWYGLFIGRKPRRSRYDEWPNPQPWVCPLQFHATHSIRLAPGEGPVEVEPLRLKKAK